MLCSFLFNWLQKSLYVLVNPSSRLIVGCQPKFVIREISSNFLGVPGQFDSKLYLNAINRIVKAGTKYKKSLGIMVSTRQEMDFYFNLGFNVIAVGTEMNLLMDKISNLLKK